MNKNIKMKKITILMKFRKKRKIRNSRKTRWNRKCAIERESD